MDGREVKREAISLLKSISSDSIADFTIKIDPSAYTTDLTVKVRFVNAEQRWAKIDERDYAVWPIDQEPGLRRFLRMADRCGRWIATLAKQCQPRRRGGR